MNEPQDQADVLEKAAQLEADLTTARASLTSLKTEMEARDGTIASLTDQLTQSNAKVETLGNDVKTLTAERDTLRVEVETLKASQSDFDRKVAARVAELGISKTAASAAPVEPKALTLTERCLLARQGKDNAQQ